MKWREKTTFFKIIDVVMYLAFLAFLVLAILEMTDILSIQYGSKLALAAYLLCFGISYWNTNRNLAKTYLILAGLFVVLALLWILFP